MVLTSELHWQLCSNEASYFVRRDQSSTFSFTHICSKEGPETFLFLNAHAIQVSPQYKPACTTYLVFRHEGRFFSLLQYIESVYLRQQWAWYLRRRRLTLVVCNSLVLIGSKLFVNQAWLLTTVESPTHWPRIMPHLLPFPSFSSSSSMSSR